MIANSIEKQMQACHLCPRHCGANRLQGQKGFCNQTAEVRAARAALHMWEEPCISGTKGSGTVFFSGCGLRCVFCQNNQIANGNVGESVSIERLADIFLELQEQGANNINLVTAGHFVPQVIKALELAKRNGLFLPIVYNTGSYEEVDTIRMLEGYIDVYLPDLKFCNSEISQKYTMAGDYFEKATLAIAEMVRQVSNMEFVPEKELEQKAESSYGVERYQELEEQGAIQIMTRGVIVRHLILPGQLEDSKKIVEYLLKQYGTSIFISLMNQYTPLVTVENMPELSRRVTKYEYQKLIEFAIEHGIENGFIQEGRTAMESFIPEFDGKGITARAQGVERLIK